MEIDSHSAHRRQEGQGKAASHIHGERLCTDAGMQGRTHGGTQGGRFAKLTNAVEVYNGEKFIENPFRPLYTEKKILNCP